jgi:S1-C subfamily serine protease
MTATLLAVLVATVAPALAGEGKKCSHDTQACLDEMADKLAGRGWVGIEYDANEAGAVLVRKVVPGSPAASAGLLAGDRLVAVNDIPLDGKHEAELESAWSAMVPGTRLAYTVERAGGQTQVAVTLGKMPEDVVQRIVGAHMLEHAATRTAQR